MVEYLIKQRLEVVPGGDARPSPEAAIGLEQLDNEEIICITYARMSVFRRP